MSKVEFSPIRSMDKFVSDFSQFRLPSLQTPDKWMNRVVSNLLYFQTNYFILTIVLFVIISIYHPKDMMISWMLLAVIFGAFAHVTNAQEALKRLKKTHPTLGVFFILVACLFGIHLLSSILVFLFGIALPLLLIMLHASCRTRSLSNKFTNKMEYVGIKRTPMGLILEAIGLEEHSAA